MIRYQITDGKFAEDSEGWMQRLRKDVDYIQIRENCLTTKDLTALIRRVVQAIPVPVIVNDRIDVAIASGAAGVHLRGGSVSPARVRQFAPLIITVAAHSEADLKNLEGAHYALLSPIFSPRSKPDDRPPLGLETLRRLAAASSVPVLALGGITSVNASLCVSAGAAGVAGISLWDDE